MGLLDQLLGGALGQQQPQQSQMNGLVPAVMRVLTDQNSGGSLFA